MQASQDYYLCPLSALVMPAEQVAQAVAAAQPTAERLLEAFEEITLTGVENPSLLLRHLTPLSALQQRILALLDFTPSLYTNLCGDSSEPP